jgi:hypothetical protein
MKPTDQQLEDFAAQGKAIYTLEVGEHTVVITAPTRPEYKRFQSRASNPKMDAVAALEDLARSALLFPSKADAEKIVEEELAGFLETIGGEVAKLAQGAAKVDSKKYQTSPPKP